jgi:signal transduction histidine kinase
MVHDKAAIEGQNLQFRMRLELADRILDDALVTVPIELRASLRSILSLGRLIREFDGAMNADTREYVDYIRASVEHMSATLSRLRPLPDTGRTTRATVDAPRSVRQNIVSL